MVQKSTISNLDCRIPPFLSHLYRASLHLRFYVGTPNLHSFWNLASCVHPIDCCHIFHYCCVIVLPTRKRRSSMVVGCLHQWRNDRYFYLHLLLLLLFPSKWDDRFITIVLLLWIYVDCIFRILPHAWVCRLPIQFGVCKIHLLSREMRLKNNQCERIVRYEQAEGSHGYYITHT